MICFLLLVIYGKGYTQFGTDSLQDILHSPATKNEGRLQALMELSKIFETRNFTAAKTYTRDGKLLAAKMHNDFSLAEFCRIGGKADYFRGYYDSAAREWYQALGIFKKLNQPAKQGEILLELGKLYRKTKDLDRALVQYNEAEEIYTRLGDQTSLGTVYNESGVVFEYKHDFEEAIRRYNQSMAIRLKENDSLGLSYSLNFLGGAYMQKNEFKKAEDYLVRSLQIRHALKDSLGIALSFADLGSMFLEVKQYSKARNYYDSSQAIATALHYPQLSLEIFQQVSRSWENENRPDSAYSYFKKYSDLKDSLFSKEKFEQVESLNAFYETEKKNDALALSQANLQKRNLFIIILITGLLFIIILSYVVYSRNKARHALNLQQTVMEQQDLAARAVITAEEAERQRIAADLHDGIGQMMSATRMNLSALEENIRFPLPADRQAFEKIISMVDESCREVRAVSHQMMPNALLKSGLAVAVRAFITRLDARVIKVTLHTEDLDQKLNEHVEIVLYRVIQEAVNNVIKHAAATHLDISILKDETGIDVTIEDDGRGFDTASLAKQEGIGFANMRTRINYLKGSLEINSRAGKGTLIAIHIPATY
ncbi:MAG: sensor histidine kinase [Ferruginibacter sp.]